MENKEDGPRTKRLQTKAVCAIEPADDLKRSYNSPATHVKVVEKPNIEFRGTVDTDAQIQYVDDHFEEHSHVDGKLYRRITRTKGLLIRNIDWKIISILLVGAFAFLRWRGLL